jgi:sulfate permease, SulP family
MQEERWWSPFIPKTIVCLQEKYTLQKLRQDLLAGFTVGVMALPLAMAFAIASGVGPERGLFTAIVAGFLISLLGGSRVQIGGPTGAFVVIIYGVIQRHGYEGLVLASFLASILLVFMGIIRFGNLIKYFPRPLIIGFTSGLGLLIFTSQVKDFFGMPIGPLPIHFCQKWKIYCMHFSQINLFNFSLAAATLALILYIRRFMKSLPWAITAIIFATIVSVVCGLQIETIGSRFGEIPRMLPTPSLPLFDWKWEQIYPLIPDAITIALLAGVESLLSALVADQMIGGKHKSNCELVAQGIANFGSVIFGGIPATGAVARTAVNVQSGGRTPFAGMIHAVVLLLLMLFLAPLVSYIPLAALSAVLMIVAWNMSEVHQFVKILKENWSVKIVLLTTFCLTVLIDLIMGITGGMVVFGVQRAFQKLKEPVVLK